MISPRDIDLTRVLTAWFGIEDDQKSPLPPEVAWLPADVREPFSVTSRDLWRSRGVRHYCLPRATRVDRRRSIFMEDDDLGYLWAFDVTNPGEVWEHLSFQDGWHVMREKLSEFVLHHSLIGITRSPLFYTARSNVDMSRLSDVTQGLEEIGFGGWDARPDDHVFISDDMVMQFIPAKSGWPSNEDIPGVVLVEAAARSADGLSHLVDIQAGGKWYRHEPDGRP